MSSSAAALVKVITQPDATIIARVEQLLEQARAGEVRALGYATVLQDGHVQTCIVNDGVNCFTMLGALERLKLRYHNTTIDEYE